jgi:hypothetical protein
MKYSPDLFKAVDHCQHRSFITNKYTGARIAVDCGQCDYCIHKRAKKASMRVKTAGSAFKYSYFVTLTYDNEHIPLMRCSVLHSEYEDVVGISGDIHFGNEHHQYIPVSEYQCDDNSMLRHIFFEQVQGTVPFDREIKEYLPVKDNWFLSMDAIRSFINKTQAVDKTDYPASAQYGRDNLIPFLNYVDVQNYIKRLRKHLSLKLGSYETLHFYAVGEYGPVHFRPHYHLLLFTNSDKVSEVLRYCHDKSWKLGRSDFQRSAGGASSYVASYVNSLCSSPLLYHSCRAFRPRSRASVGFFEKGCNFVEGEEPYAQIEQKIDSVVNGRVYNFNGISVRSTPPMSYIRTLLPRFSSARNDDSVTIAGKGVSSNSGHTITYDCGAEHQVIMCVYHAVPMLDWNLTGQNPQLTVTAISDFPQPAFDQLGMQVVPALNLQNNPGRAVSGSLGYNLRYWQWKSNIDTVHAGFRAGAAYQSWAAPLDGWQVLTGSGAWSYQSMKVRPQQLNSIFVPQVDAANCSVAYDQLLCNVNFQVYAVQNLDRNGLPY